MKPPAPPLLIVISAPSGGGKTTLCQQLLAARPHLTRAVTCTTRPPRPGERDGVDYHFLNQEQFEQSRAAGEFLEHATVYGNSYGTRKADIMDMLREGRDVLLSVDVQGAASIRELASKDPELSRALLTVFLTPESLQALEARLHKRNSDSPETIVRRLKEASREIARWREFEFLLISSTVAEDLRRMLLIIDSERMRSNRLRKQDVFAK